MIGKLGFIAGFIIVITLCVFFPLLVVVAFPFMILCLQKIGVVPK